MKLHGEHHVNASPDQVWQLLVDPDVLKRCTPGCERLDQIEANTYEAALQLGIGAIKGKYTGRIRLEELRPPAHLKMSVDGRGTQGFVKGNGTLELTALDSMTKIVYSGDVQLGGPLAGIGQRLIQSSATVIAGQFFTALDAEIAARRKAATTGAPVTPPSHGIVRTFLRYLWGLIKRLFAS
ncbi:MAG: carbon monoxide dehydrogenase subunit G [Acidobacteriota bacterium]|nr:carbon monoxide dehydrogenase subunit G [Blastocatellia bacterium]MDW8240853.1 carbon monoxide dehydrogenase subunit G [Acidobacteriota bacterium]